MPCAPLRVITASYLLPVEKLLLPEKNLLFAILDRALNDAFFCRNPVIRGEARKWILEDNELAYGDFSFNWCCMHLSIDSGDLRGRFRAMISPYGIKPKRSYAKFDFLSVARNVRREE